MSGESYEYNAVRGNSLERIDLFMLLDLLGAKNPKILSLQPKTDVSAILFFKSVFIF
jgi:hypothetical protein